VVNWERILSAIRAHLGLDDDELAEFVGIRSRQSVNQDARLLAGRGLVQRVIGPRGKLVNLPAETDNRQAVRPVPANTQMNRGSTRVAGQGADTAEEDPRPRAAHSTAARRVGLVGCVKEKLGRAAPAETLYISDLFCKRAAHVKESCDEWVILSAKHGVVDPQQELAPYDTTLRRAPTRERREWSGRVLMQLEERYGPLAGITFEVHAGHEYWGFGLSEGLQARGARFEYPVAGLRIGEQLAWYSRRGRA
jgi:hypothetical protein